MPSAKQEAEAMIRALPDNATCEDMQYRLYVLDKIRKSQESVAQNGVLSQEEAETRLQKWLTK